MSSAATASPARASFVDLAHNDSGVINGAIFMWVDSQSTGSGVIDPFVRIQADGTEEGYNTSADSLPFDTKAGGFTHDLRLSDVPLVDLEGYSGLYRHFLLDINETSGGSLLSLDALQLYVSDAGSQSTTDVGSLGSLIYDLDAGEDSYILLDYRRNTGSGSGDMYAFIPAGAFANAGESDFVYLYSKFGVTYGSDDGFEEWAIIVPTPGTLALLAAAALIGVPRRRRGGSRV